ncbi:MAG TPA: hypothetical protein VEY94_13280 [Patescibacteria group bacterium]|nr:hypothetical protein [Patescibacteria group bacterium]
MAKNRADLCVAQSCPPAPGERQSRGRWPSLALTLLLPATTVLCNFVIGAVTPITLWPKDDMMLLDAVWRYVQGQHLDRFP